MTKKTSQRETPESISTWSIEMFGRQEPLSIVIRAMNEAAELLTACYWGHRESILEEMADVAIILSQVPSLDHPEFEPWSPGVGTPRVREPLHFATQIGEDLLGLISHMDAVPKVVFTTADIFLNLRWLAHNLGTDLQTEVDRKMQINRARQWGRLASGRAQHLD